MIYDESPVVKESIIIPAMADSVSPMRVLLDTSAKTKFHSLNLCRLLYPQTQKNEIEVSLKHGVA